MCSSRYIYWLISSITCRCTWSYGHTSQNFCSQWQNITRCVIFYWANLAEGEMSVFQDGFRDGVACLVKSGPTSAMSWAASLVSCRRSISITCPLSLTFFISLFSHSYLFIHVQRGSTARRSWTSWTHREKSFGLFDYVTSSSLQKWLNYHKYKLCY